MVRVKLCFGFVILSLVALMSLWFAGCTRGEVPEGALTCSAYLSDPLYDREVTLYGEVHSLPGDASDPNFVLVSGGGEIVVWYDSMVEDDGTERPPVSIAGIDNGDQVIVIGELKTAGEFRSLNDFWAISIEKY